MPIDPMRYPNARGDNPFDDDAVDWLLTQPGVAQEFSRVQLFECARRQRRLLKAHPARVERAAALCGQYHVEQIPVFDPKIGKTIWRLRRTDPGTPADYPDYDATRDPRAGAPDAPPAPSPASRADAKRESGSAQRPSPRADSYSRSVQKTPRRHN
jgi:hypothetical protein